METEVKEPPVKKFRQRKKLKFNLIRKQMEFYFGDANLARDRFVMQLIKSTPDSFVPLEEFLKFNKIKALTDRYEDIAKAISTSEMLTVSEDGKKVKRKTKIQTKEDTDDCTIYVESLPKTATHDYVTEIFAPYGDIAYISLPRYKHSRKIKEFGFVEFKVKESVDKALEAFKKWNGVLSYNVTDPEKLQSIVSFKKEQEAEKQGLKEGEIEEKPEVDESDVEPPPAKKAKTEADEVVEDKEPAADENLNVENTEGAATDTEVAEGEAEDNTDPAKKKKGGKKERPIDPRVYDLKIMAKKEWKRLRNKYLTLQRERFREIKQKLQAGRKKQEGKKKQVEVKPIKASPRKINFYGALPDRKSGGEEPPEVEEPVVKKPTFSFEPGLIVNIKFQVPLVDVKEFKAELKQLQYVKYVDVKEGALEAFVRVDKVACANLLVKYYSSGEYQSQILSGEVEQNYWRKMMQDRDKKLSKAVKVKTPRGRERLQKKIAVHTRFEEDATQV